MAIQPVPSTPPSLTPAVTQATGVKGVAAGNDSEKVAQAGCAEHRTDRTDR
jgi:hypothetical protein